MGQFTLGLRSLLIKATIFVIMAALLAWALGGTLWPRPHVTDLRLSRITVGQHQYFWRVSQKERLQDFAAWQLMAKSPDSDDPKPADERAWLAGAGPVVVDQTVYFGGCDASGQWTMVKLSPPERTVNTLMPDRLAVEQQLARLASGLPMQDAQTILKQRQAVLNPGDPGHAGVDPGDPKSESTLHPSTKPADELKAP